MHHLMYTVLSNTGHHYDVRSVFGINVFLITLVICPARAIVVFFPLDVPHRAHRCLFVCSLILQPWMRKPELS